MLKLVNNSCYFEIVINSLSEVLNELNINHEIVLNYEINDENNIYLICTTHENRELPKKYISYNFEQLITDKIWDNNFYKKLENAELVLDYSLENIKELKQKNIIAYFLPLGYTKNMEFNNDVKINKTIDFTFLGCLNETRYMKLQPLINHYKKKKDNIVISSNYWDEDLKNLYKKTKIGLNIHYYTGKTILEVHRIIPMIANKILVISERSNDIWYDEKYSKIVTFVNNNMYIEGLQLLKQYNEEEINKRYNELITNNKYIDNIKEILPLIEKII